LVAATANHLLLTLETHHLVLALHSCLLLLALNSLLDPLELHLLCAQSIDVLICACGPAEKSLRSRRCSLSGNSRWPRRHLLLRLLHGLSHLGDPRSLLMGGRRSGSWDRRFSSHGSVVCISQRSKAKVCKEVR
tara:strand:+ start:142 stop:543 length:402 start_codon:yes stop_codon:yes gene_type:complete